MKQPKVVLFEGINPSAIDVFKNHGIENIHTYKTSIENAGSEVFDADIVGIRSRSKITKDILAKFTNLSCIGCFCIGTDQVSLEDSKSLGIPVFNAPFSNTRSVAELVIAEIISLMRNLHTNNLQMHNGIWQKNATGCYEIKGKTLGIIGYGNIGAQVGIIAEVLGMTVIYYDIEKKLPFGLNRQVNSIDEILQNCDVITLHVPQDESTKNLINEKTLSKMKKSSFLINASRGTIVDIDALCKFLQNNHIAGAALDVFPVEPASNKDIFESPLIKFENVILTPHIGGSTEEAQVNIAHEVSHKLAEYYLKGSSQMAVNFPNVSLQKLKNKINTIRITHCHSNITGVMKAINEVMEKFNINIQSQTLATDENIGYVILDVELQAISQDLLIELKKVKGTILVRVLY